MGGPVSRRKVTKRKKGGFTPPKEVTIVREVVYVREETPRARPVQTGYMQYACSRCGTSCYYDGRCGDGPVLMCKCDDYSEWGWADGGNRR